ncbi:hypothetical protein MKW92_037943 [Papaver armeniacum]|nr:hypothetical protein MKW92_037943 [Papaver armeniacum]
MDEVMTTGDAMAPSTTIPFGNLPILSALLAGFLAQFLKIFTTWYKEKRWTSKKLFDSGGMPSSHSAAVTALATAIGFQDGIGGWIGGSLFPLAVVFAAVVMYDTSGVGLHAGMQAEVIAGAILGCIVSNFMRRSA